MTIKDTKEPVSTSTAGAGEGISFPHGKKEQAIGTKDQGVIKKRYLWFGGEYSEDDSWIEIRTDDFVDVEQ